MHFVHDYVEVTCEDFDVRIMTRLDHVNELLAISPLGSQVI